MGMIRCESSGASHQEEAKADPSTGGFGWGIPAASVGAILGEIGPKLAWELLRELLKNAPFPRRPSRGSKQVPGLGVEFSRQVRFSGSPNQVVVTVRVFEHVSDTDGSFFSLLPILRVGGTQL